MIGEIVCNNCKATFSVLGTTKGSHARIVCCPFCGSKDLKEPGKESVADAARRGFKGDSK